MKKIINYFFEDDEITLIKPYKKLLILEIIYIIIIVLTMLF